MKNLFSKSNKGFTLIETLVALSIFSVSIVALISITGSGVSNTNYAKNKFIASYLSQEGIEAVRNIRDTTLLSGGVWTDFTSLMGDNGCTNLTTGCMVEPQDLTVMACPAECWILKYDPSTGFYGYSSGSDSNFTRVITIDSFGGAGVNVTSQVWWYQGSVFHSTSNSQMLMDWIQPSESGPPLE